MEINKAMSICIESGVKVYPVQLSITKIFIESDNNGEVTRYKKELNSLKDINSAITKTYIFLAERIIKNSTKVGV